MTSNAYPRVKGGPGVPGAPGSAADPSSLYRRHRGQLVLAGRVPGEPRPASQTHQLVPGEPERARLRGVAVPDADHGDGARQSRRVGTRGRNALQVRWARPCARRFSKILMRPNCQVGHVRVTSHWLSISANLFSAQMVECTTDQVTGAPLRASASSIGALHICFSAQLTYSRMSQRMSQRRKRRNLFHRLCTDAQIVCVRHPSSAFDISRSLELPTDASWTCSILPVSDVLGKLFLAEILCLNLY